MRPTGLGHGVYKDNVDFGVFCGDWCIGRIYETRTGPADLRWFWALYAPSKPGTLRTDSRAATLDQAKAEFEASWKQWKAWAGWRKLSCAITGRKQLQHLRSGEVGRLLNDLVCAYQECVRYCKAERLCSDQVNDEVVSSGLLNWQIT